MTELPIGRWTQDYKEFLVDLSSNETTKAARYVKIKSFTEHHTENSVRFIISLSRESLRQAEERGLHSAFKLETNISMNNMHLFDRDGVITKYTDPNEILCDFFDVRLELYERRREYLIRENTLSLSLLRNKRKFIEEVSNGSLVLMQREKREIVKDLRERGYTTVQGEEEDKG